MNYEMENDLEINERLAVLLAEKDIKEAGEVGEFTPQEWLDMHDWLKANYCHDWSAIGPLIVEHDLTIMNPHKELGYDNWSCLSVFSPVPYAVEHQNPLRAAAICIIQVLEGESQNQSQERKGGVVVWPDAIDWSGNPKEIKFVDIMGENKDFTSPRYVGEGGNFELDGHKPLD